MSLLPEGFRASGQFPWSGRVEPFGTAQSSIVEFIEALGQVDAGRWAVVTADRCVSLVRWIAFCGECVMPCRNPRETCLVGQSADPTRSCAGNIG
jgi:hypothetical protein